MNFEVRHRYIIILFFLAVIIYGIIALFFTSTVHVEVDEELYVALAKSFHYKGRFEVSGNAVNYNCVLYSMMISLAYYFYSPERILFLMRLIGIISMCSAVFPIYFLAKMILEDDRKAFAFSGMTLMLPYMFDCMYLMQEVLSYPLFLWTAYFLYQTYRKPGLHEGRMWLMAGALFSALCFYTKTYMFFIPVAVNMCFVLWGIIKKHESNVITQLLLYDAIYLLCTGSLYLVIRSINGGSGGSNHYATQFSALFPISIWTFISGFICIIIYFSLLLFNMGVFPVVALIFNEDKLNKNNRYFRDFCLIACVLMVFEIVFLIVLTEEGVPTIPHKFLFRYFQVLVPPILIIYIKILEEQDFLKNKMMWILLGGSLCVCLCYFGYMQGITRQAIADGYLYLTLENAAKYVLPYADVAAVALVGAAIIVAIGLVCKGRMGVINKVFKLGVVGIMLFWILNCIQLPVYTNIIADGKTIQNDSVKIAEYLNKTDCDLYYLAASKEDRNSYLRNFYGYVRQTYRVIDIEELNQMATESGRGYAFLISSQRELEIEGMERINLETDRLHLYLLPN